MEIELWRFFDILGIGAFAFIALDAAFETGKPHATWRTFARLAIGIIAASFDTYLVLFF